MRPHTQTWRLRSAASPVSGLRKGSPGRNLSTLLVCLLFSLIYISIPWPEIFASIYGYPMIDRRIYEIQILLHDLSVDHSRYESSISYIFGEYLWGSAIRFLSRQMGLGSDTIFAGISAIAIFAFSLTVARTIGLPWIVFLLNPLVVDFAFSQLRLALAIGLALIFIHFYMSRPIRAAAVAVGLSMIHTASMLFFFMGGMAKMIPAKAAWSKRYIALIPPILSGMIVSFLIGPAREAILSAAGDRRVTYHDMSSSGLYLSFWIALLFILIYRWKSISNRFETAFVISILSLVATNLLTSGYSTRFIAAAFPFLIISMASLDGIYRIIVVYAFIFYVLYQWVHWFRLLG